MTKQRSLLSQNIEKRMYQVGFKNVAELADKSGVSRSVLANVAANPNKTISFESALKLCKALKCRPEWLHSGEGYIDADDVDRKARLKMGAPIINLSVLKDSSPAEALTDVYYEEHRERYPCPAGNAESTFIIRSDKTYGKFISGGLMYFDYNKKPVAGNIIIAKSSPDAAPEILEYVYAHGKEYIKSFDENIPVGLQSIPMEDNIQILATMTSFAFNI